MIYTVARWHNRRIRRDRLPDFLKKEKIIVIPDVLPANPQDRSPFERVFFPQFNDLEDLSSYSEDRVKSVYSDVMNDARLFFLLDRGDRGTFRQANFRKATEVILPAIQSAVHLLGRLSPTGIYFAATPHELLPFVFERAAFCMGIPTYMRVRTYIPGFYVVKIGLDSDTIVSMGNCCLAEKETKVIHDIASEKKGRGDGFLAPSERRTISRLRSPLARFKFLLSLALCRPDAFIHNVRCRRAYSKLAVRKIDADKNSIIFFLHYQPEKTTLPEGGLFVQQTLAINLLASAMPKGYRLYVREHPSTFTRHCSSKTRSPAFYEAISKIPRTDLLSMAEETAEIIEHCNFVATVNGTVAGDAMFNNIPAIIFGKGQWSGFSHPRMHKFTNFDALNLFLREKEKWSGSYHFSGALERFISRYAFHQENARVLVKSERLDMHLEVANRIERASNITGGE